MEDPELQEKIKKQGGEKLPAGDFGGPATVDRGCTDILCILIFVAFWAGMLIICSLAIQTGRPDRLWRGYDFAGQVCGEGYNSGSQAVYYPRPPTLNYAVCLPTCPLSVVPIMCVKTVFDVPTNTLCPAGLTLSSSSSFAQLQQINNCLQNFTIVLSNPLSVQYGWCFPTYPTGPLNTTGGYSRCLPFGIGTNTSSYIPAITNTSAPSNFSYTDLQQVYSDPSLAFTLLISNVASNYVYILVSAAVALVVCLVYTTILRFAAGIITWLTLLLVELVLGALSALLLFKAGVLQPSSLPQTVQNAIPSSITNSFGWTFKATADEMKIFLAIGIISGVAFVLGFFFIIFMCSRIRLAIQIVKEASRAIGALPGLLLLPVVIWGALVLLFVYWVVVLLYIFTSGQYDPATGNFSLTLTMKRAAIYHLFGLLWTRSFIFALGDITMAGAVAQYYWGDKSILEQTTLRSFLRTMRYHIGTAAVGSFIIALVEFIRMCVNYYTNKMKGMEKNSRIVAAIRSCTDCCLACLERFLKFASKQAYIQTAIHGTNFFRSCMNAFMLLLRNTLRLAAISVLGNIFVNIGKVFIASVTCLIGAIMIVVAHGQGPLDFSSADPLSVLIIFVLGFAVASGFMNVFQMVIDTLFQCFCEECERNPSGPTKAGPKLRKFMDNNHSANRQ